MKKYKMRHYETLKRDLFPRMIPHPIFSGETKQEREAAKTNEPQMGHNPEPQRVYDWESQQPTLDEIWKWLDNPDE